MDCLGLLGETPIMGPPPKVCPVNPVLDPAPELPLAAAGSVLAVPPEGPPGLTLKVLVPAWGAFGSAGAPEELGGEPLAVEPGTGPLPDGELNMPRDGLGPVEPGPVPANAGPPMGWPKKPIDWVLFWPMRMIFHSSLPVVGSMYFLRRKRISLVMTSASMLGG